MTRCHGTMPMIAVAAAVADEVIEGLKRRAFLAGSLAVRCHAIRRGVERSDNGVPNLFPWSSCESPTRKKRHRVGSVAAERKHSRRELYA